MHEEKIKHQMIDDVWNSRRQSTQKKKNSKNKVYCMAAGLLKKIIWPKTCFTIYIAAAGHFVQL